MGWRLGLPRGLQGTRGYHLSMSHCEAMHDGCIAGGSKAPSQARVEQGEFPALLWTIDMLSLY